MSRIGPDNRRTMRINLHISPTEYVVPRVLRVSKAVEGLGHNLVTKDSTMKTKLMIAALIAGVAATGATAAGFGRGGDDHGRRGEMGEGMGPNGLPPMFDFATLDTNGDGSLTLEELQAAPAARFAEADTDGNGALSQDELKAQEMARIEQMAANRAQMMIAQRDTNGDGELSADELQKNEGQGLAVMFARLDADADGTVTAEEFAAAQTRMQARMGDDHGHGMMRGQQAPQAN